jgi:hypothetical protein
MQDLGNRRPKKAGPRKMNETVEGESADGAVHRQSTCPNRTRALAHHLEKKLSSTASTADAAITPSTARFAAEPPSAAQAIAFLPCAKKETTKADGGGSDTKSTASVAPRRQEAVVSLAHARPRKGPVVQRESTGIRGGDSGVYRTSIMSGTGCDAMRGRAGRIGNLRAEGGMQMLMRAEMWGDGVETSKSRMGGIIGVMINAIVDRLVRGIDVRMKDD